MKMFLGIFVCCIVFVTIIFSVFMVFLVGNYWGIIFVSAFLLAILITVLARQSMRIEELERLAKKQPDSENISS